MQPSGVAGSRAQRATLRQSSSPQTRQQVKASHTLRTTLAQVARRSVPNPRGITGDRVAHPGRRGATRVAPSHPDSGGCNHFHWYHAPHFDSITWMSRTNRKRSDARCRCLCPLARPTKRPTRGWWYTRRGGGLENARTPCPVSPQYRPPSLVHSHNKSSGFGSRPERLGPV